jgi:hypothetical protein
VKRITMLFISVLARPAHAERGDFSLGISIGVPGQGSGLPIGAQHLPGGLAARFELSPFGRVIPAISGGAGSPIAGDGASIWAGVELRMVPIDHLAIYATPGARAGFVGTGYYARRSHVFVGYEYLYSGPWTIAPRLSIGVATPISRFEIFIEALSEAPLWPTPEILFGGALGFRVRL